LRLRHKIGKLDFPLKVLTGLVKVLGMGSLKARLKRGSEKAGVTDETKPVLGWAGVLDCCCLVTETVEETEANLRGMNSVDSD